jgi:hypothetical protein
MARKRFRRKPRTFINVNPVGEGFVVRHQVEGKPAFFVGTDGLWVRQRENVTPFATRAHAEERLQQESDQESNRR